MKKFLSVLLLIALLISCCACGNEQSDPSDTTEGTVSEFADINELEPDEDGVYQIHSIEGLKNIANHLDAEFEVLCNIDLNGAEWTPIGTEAAPFTGEINGNDFTISNFTISTPTADGDMGVFGVCDGQVKDLYASNVTVTTNASTKRAGLWAGYCAEDGQFLRCGVTTSSLTAAELADGAAVGSIVGVNEGEFRNGTMKVDLTVTASAKADIGGIAGIAADGKIQFVKNEGFIEVTGGSNKNVGMFVGTLEDAAEVKGTVYLGSSNNIDGVLFADFAGVGDDADITDASYRDNAKEEIDPVILEKRQKAVEAMRAQGSIVWRVPKTLRYSCTCSLSSCAGLYQPEIEIHGVVYNHKGGSLERLKYCLGDDDVLDEWCYLGDFDGFDSYIGSDCSTAVLQAYWAVSANANFSRTRYQWPAQERGCVAVGDWEWDLGYLPSYTDAYLEATGEQRMYEAYGCLRAGDYIVNTVEAGGHTRMVTEDAVVVRYADGTINPGESYIITTEQGAPRTTEPYFSSWRVDYKYSFTSIYVDWYIPGTIEEFVTGEFEEPEAYLLDGVEGKAGLTTGTVYSNFFLDSVTMTIEDSTGAVVFEQRMFTTVGKQFDSNATDTVIRVNNHEYDLASFATPLREFMFELGEEYHCTITAHVGSGDDFVVKDYTFVNGTAHTA